MSAQFRLTVDVAGLRRDFSRVEREQIPFALALALTRSAEEAVQAEIQTLPQKFIVRRNWIAKGFRVDRATKAKLVATVRHLDAFMYLQEYGGEKTPGAGRSHVADPKGLGARPVASAITPQSMWPGKIIGTRGFIMRNSKDGREFVFARVAYTQRGKVRKGKRNQALAALPHRGRDPGIRLMYSLKREVTIKPRLGLVDTIRKTAADRMALNFNGFLPFAVRTAR